MPRCDLLDSRGRDVVNEEGVTECITAISTTGGSSEKSYSIRVAHDWGRTVVVMVVG